MRFYDWRAMVKRSTFAAVNLSIRVLASSLRQILK